MIDYVRCWTSDTRTTSHRFDEAMRCMETEYGCRVDLSRGDLVATVSDAIVEYLALKGKDA